MSAITTINDIPDELWENIISFLSIKYLLIISEVSRKYYHIMHEINYFKKYLKNSNSKHYLKFNKKTYEDMKILKYLNKWDKVPICFMLNEYNLSIIGLNNLFQYYISYYKNIIKIDYINNIYKNNLFKNNKQKDILIPKQIKNIVLYLPNIVDNNNNRISTLNYNIEKQNKIEVLSVINLMFSIDKLAYFTNLKVLKIDNLHFDLNDNIKKQLSNINTLKLFICPESYDFSFLKNNKKLVHQYTRLSSNDLNSYMNNEELTLIIYSENIIDTSVLKNNKKLRKLTIQGLCFNSLNGLENIYKLIAYKTNIISIPNLMFCKIIDLSYTFIKNKDLEKLLNVEKLKISYCKNITDVSIFGADNYNSKLKVLDISFNEQIIDINNLYNLNELNIIGLDTSLIYVSNNMNRFTNTIIYDKICLCDKCFNLLQIIDRYYYENIKHNIHRKNNINMEIKCLYEETHNWFDYLI